MKTVKIKKSDLAKLPPSILNDPEAMAIIHKILDNFTEIERRYGFDLVLESDAPAPVEHEAAPVESAPVATGPTCTLSKLGTSGTDLTFHLEHSHDWPIEHGGEHDFVGDLMMQSDQMPKAVKVDGMSTANVKAGHKTLSNAFGGGDHSLNVARGEHLRVWIRQGKLTSNIVDWHWPLAGT